MATVINTQPAAAENSSGLSFLLGVIVLAVMALLLYYYGLPALRTAATPASSMSIEVPEQVDVNVNQGQ